MKWLPVIHVWENLVGAFKSEFLTCMRINIAQIQEQPNGAIREHVTKHVINKTVSSQYRSANFANDCHEWLK